MSLMSDQLLKAGLVTEEQVEKAKEKPINKNHHKDINKKNKNLAKRKNSTKKHSEPSDLEQFYQMRASEENNEKQALLKKKREDAQRKKEMNAKVNKLISNNILNDKEAEIRYNFVVGTTIKYVFVNEKQQEQLANGELAITFLGGNRCIIPAKTGKEVLDVNPKKIVIVASLSED